ncbi:MFS transporter [Herbaspirillum hiltneri N3]|uniref:MFS transporter n=1 Tax=Herbaspirillum hiltneri N3 TaxID=1262470 RepID=A0ABN4I1K5_9BURK|nr:MFS transporter [Herbaspirillum hiltneri]AKZ64985.1 MFS transporter [Herbaspirillum hiltneri N3]
MSATTQPAPAHLSPPLFSAGNPALWVVVAAALVLSVVMGTRQTFGLYINPFSYDRGLPVTVIAFAIALHNLVWGFAQPFAGAAADRYGATPVVAFGAVTFAAGLGLAAVAPSGLLLVIGLGLLVGIGISCTSFGVVLASVGRVATPQQRSMAMGIASAGGSLGQVLLVPLAQMVREGAGVPVSLFVLAVIALAIAPAGLILDRGRKKSPASVTHAAAEPDTSSLKEVLALAGRHRGYRLLTIGFFTCGFQLAFIGTHLPGYLMLCHMPLGLGATALALIGLFNMAGSWGCGWLGGRFRQQYVLGWLYLIRSGAIAVFLALPTTGASVMVFAAVMGLTWLGTVPLTSGLVAKVFGTRHLGTLFGVCFLSHQLGSFLGAWLGGYMFDLTGSYSLVWGATVAAGVLAALLHFAIGDKPADASPGMLAAALS